jgi:hypothetical protein
VRFAGVDDGRVVHCPTIIGGQSDLPRHLID